MKRYYEIACQNIKLISCTPTRHSQSFHKLSTLCLFFCPKIGATISMTKLNRTAQSLYLQHLIAQSHSLSKSLSNSSSHNETSASQLLRNSSISSINFTLYLTSTQILSKVSSQTLSLSTSAPCNEIRSISMTKSLPISSSHNETSASQSLKLTSQLLRNFSHCLKVSTETISMTKPNSTASQHRNLFISTSLLARCIFDILHDII